jgi:N-acetylglucosamine-6-phosphate deacetylase
MKEISLENAEIILPDEKIQKGSLLIQDEAIAEISLENKHFRTDEVFDLSNLTVYAGYIDIHNHGAVGFDVNSATANDFRAVSKFLAANGVTAWLPTLVPDYNESYEKSIKAIKQVMELQKNEPVAQILGVHYEGVFANEKMCGALHTEFFRTFASSNEIEKLPKINDEKALHFMTLAPEIENGIELIKELRQQNWIVSIGHTRGDLETLEAACRAGAKHLTHFFNAMTGLHHRDVGVVGWGMTSEEVSFDIIADGVHVHPKILQFACQTKAIEKIILISDSVSPTGLGDGDFEIWGEKISVIEGKTQNDRGSIAGSVITLLDAVKMMLSLGFSPSQVSRMASANPARLLGIEKTHGSIQIGKRADLVALDYKGNIKLVLCGGKICFDAI